MTDNRQDALSSPLADPLDEAAIRELSSNVRGQLIRPQDATYDEARTMFVDAIDRDVAQTIVDHLQASKAQMAVAQIRVLGGAMARVSAEATAFAHRKRRIMVNVAALYERPDEAAVYEAWITDFAAALRQDNDSGAYVGFLGEEGEARIREAYPGSTYERLAAIKARYDPTNLFRLNQNIRPSAKPTSDAVSTATETTFALTKNRPTPS